MTTEEPQQKELNAKRFAALLAGFDTGNASEEEALSKGRALRRMASTCGLRIVDALEMPDVKRAIDDQMQPKRQDNVEVEYALEQLALLREQLGERTTELEKLKLSFEEEKQLFDLHALQLEKRFKQAGRFLKPSLGAQSWILEIALVFHALTLMWMAAFR